MAINYEENLRPEEKKDDCRDPSFFRNRIIERTPFPKPRRSKPIFHRINNMTYPLSIPPCSKKSFPIECTEVPTQPAMTRRIAMAQKVQYYIETKCPQAFEAIIDAQIEISEAPPGDGNIPFVSMQTVDGESISVLPTSTRLLSALRRWNNKNTPKFLFTVYHSEDGGLLHQSDAQTHAVETPKNIATKKRRPTIQRSASMISPKGKLLK